MEDTRELNTTISKYKELKRLMQDWFSLAEKDEDSSELAMGYSFAWDLGYITEAEARRLAGRNINSLLDARKDLPWEHKEGTS